jgi:hypothetical protein
VLHGPSQPPISRLRLLSSRLHVYPASRVIHPLAPDRVTVPEGSGLSLKRSASRQSSLPSHSYSAETPNRSVTRRATGRCCPG